MTKKEVISNLKDIKKIIYEVFPVTEEDKELSLDLAIKALEGRPRGEWEKPFEMNGKTYHKCTNCHISSELILINKYCPNCGANMKGTKND